MIRPSKSPLSIQNSIKSNIASELSQCTRQQRGQGFSETTQGTVFTAPRLRIKSVSTGTAEDETKLSFGLTDSSLSTTITEGNVRFKGFTRNVSQSTITYVGDPCYIYVRVYRVTPKTGIVGFYTDASYLDNSDSFFYYPLAKYELSGATYVRTMRYHRGGDITIDSYIR